MTETRRHRARAAMSASPLKGQIRLPSAYHQGRAVGYPVCSRLFPTFPSIWKALMHKHRFDIFQRQCGLAVQFFRPRAVDEESEKQPILTRRPDEIVFAREPRQLFIELPVKTLVNGSAHSFQQIGAH